MGSKYDQLWCERCNRYMLEWEARDDYSEKMSLHKFKHTQKKRREIAIMFNTFWGKRRDPTPPPTPPGEEEFWDA